MDDALIVSGREAFGELSAEAQDLGLRQRAVFQLVAEGKAGDQFHREEIHIILRAKFKDGCDVWVVQLGEGECFFAELFPRRLIGDGTARENLQSNVAIELLIVGAINLAHAARTDSLLDAVVRNNPAAESFRLCHSALMLGRARKQVNAIQGQSERQRGFSGSPREFVGKPIREPRKH